MTELPLLFLSGLLGSSHCVGMCGGFALAVGVGSPRPWDNLKRQLVYTVGRIVTYSFLGAAAGFLGQRLTRSSSLNHAQAILSIAAGGLLIWQGLKAAGLFGRKAISAGSAPCLSGGLLKSFLMGPGLLNAALAGLMTGFLPCGLVYACLALAGASGSMGLGALTMIVFGAGTAPLMIATGFGGSLLSLTGRQRLLKAAAWCVVVTGAMSVARGAWAEWPSNEPRSRCPFCGPETAAQP